MTLYLIEEKWPIYYKEGDNYFPLGNGFEEKARNIFSYKVKKELSYNEALDYIKNSGMYKYNYHSETATDFINSLIKQDFYKEVLDV